MHRLLTILLSCLIACCLFTTALAETRQLHATPLAPGSSMIATGASAKQEGCMLGVDNPVFAIQGFLLPPEGYKLAVDPTAQCEACPQGFQITAIHIALQVDQACSIVLSTDLEDALFPDGPDCPVPGELDCLSDTFLVELPGAGLYDVEIPIDCPCAFKQYTYFLGVFIESYSCEDDKSIPALITNNTPHECTSWNNFGEGWTDLTQFADWPGDLVIWADSQCCEQPVGNERDSWGAIKDLYRN